MLFRSFLCVLVLTIIYCVIIYKGVFDDINIDVGHKHYAEKATKGRRLLVPKWMKMPMNSYVNIGYTILGAYWCAATSSYMEAKLLSNSEGFMFYVFNIMAIFYGAIQALRIVIQKHEFAVLDQWFTLPFFMWTYQWGRSLAGRWSAFRILISTIFSSTSYILTLYHVHGFEMALGLNILFSVIGSLLAYRKYGNPLALKNLILAILCCTGFISLKLLDFRLLQLHKFFRVISGHFLSKLCDILQIHFVNNFFLYLTLFRLDQETKKKD